MVEPALARIVFSQVEASHPRWYCFTHDDESAYDDDDYVFLHSAAHISNVLQHCTVLTRIENMPGASHPDMSRWKPCLDCRHVQVENMLGASHPDISSSRIAGARLSMEANPAFQNTPE